MSATISDPRCVCWTIEIDALATESRVGILEHETALQPVLITLAMRASAPAFPASIAECLNYQPVCAWITGDWSQRPHTPLLETRVGELLTYIFNYDQRIDWVELSLKKTTAIPAAAAVGIRLALTRSQYVTAFAAVGPD